MTLLPAGDDLVRRAIVCTIDQAGMIFDSRPSAWRVSVTEKNTVRVKCRWSPRDSKSWKVVDFEWDRKTVMAYPAYPAYPMAESASARRTRTLRLASLLLPPAERGEWLEEQRGYLADMSGRRARWGWIVMTVLGMPRYAYTVITGREKEPA